MSKSTVACTLCAAIATATAVAESDRLSIGQATIEYVTAMTFTAGMAAGTLYGVELHRVNSGGHPDSYATCKAINKATREIVTDRRSALKGEGRTAWLSAV